MRRPAPVNPLAPLSEKAIARQSRSYVNAQILPLIAQINSEVDRRNRAGQAAIAGNTDTLAGHLAPIAGEIHARNEAAQNQQRSDDAALAAHLTGAGALQGSQLAAQLAAINAPAEQVQQVAGGATAAGAGAGATSAALGSASLAHLLAAGTAQENYASELPAFARLGGAQRSSQLGVQLENQRATQVGDVRAKVPGLLQQIIQQARDREFQKGVAIQSGLVDTAKLNASSAYQTARVTQAGLNAQETARHNAATEAAAQARIEVSRQKTQAGKNKKRSEGFYKIRTNVFKDAAKLYKGAGAATSGGGGGLGAPPSGGTSGAAAKPVPYARAYRRVFLTYMAPLRALGYTQAQIETTLRKAMAAAGYSVPGTRGPAGGQAAGSFGGRGGR